MKFSPTVWGPFFWHTIHLVAIGYPQKPSYTEKKCAKEFYESLAYLIPCGICREHYHAHLEKNPITPYLDSRTDLIRWTIQIHNQVNEMLKRPTWTLEEVMRYYERLGQRDRSPVWTKEDMNEMDYRAFVKGFVSCMALSGVAGGFMYWAFRGS